MLVIEWVYKYIVNGRLLYIEISLQPFCFTPGRVINVILLIIRLFIMASYADDFDYFFFFVNLVDQSVLYVYSS